MFLSIYVSRFQSLSNQHHQNVGPVLIFALKWRANTYLYTSWKTCICFIWMINNIFHLSRDLWMFKCCFISQNLCHKNVRWHFVLTTFFLYSLSFIDIVFFVFFLDKALVWLFNPSGIKDSQHIWVLYLWKCPFYIKLNNCIISLICVEIKSKFINSKFSQIILIGCHLS